MEGTKIYLGRIYNPLNWHSFEDIIKGAIVVNSQGIIIDYGNWDDVKGRIGNIDIKDIEDSGEKLMVPGFVDLHLHLPQYDCMAKRSDGLLHWLNDYIFPMEILFKDAHVARDTASRLISDLLRNGTTTAVMYSSVHREATEIAFEEAKKSGIRAVIGKVMMDRNSPEELLENTNESIDQSIELCKKWHGTDAGRLMYAFSPRFAVSCSKELLTAVGKIAKGKGAYIQSHLSESQNEVELVKKLFPGNSSYTDIYERTGILGERTILGHAIYLEESEYDILSHTGTKIVHLPSSNLFLRSGTMNLPKLREKNIIVGLGTDIGAGYDVSIFKVMRDALSIQPNLDPISVFYMATLNGAKALQLENKIGNFSMGKEADFLVINFQSRETGGTKTSNLMDILSLLVYRGDDRVVEQVYVRGKRVYGNPLSLK